jgi:hypothetical protein
VQPPENAGRDQVRCAADLACDWRAGPAYCIRGVDPRDLCWTSPRCSCCVRVRGTRSDRSIASIDTSGCACEGRRRSIDHSRRSGRMSRWPGRGSSIRPRRIGWDWKPSRSWRSLLTGRSPIESHFSVAWLSDGATGRAVRDSGLTRRVRRRPEPALETTLHNERNSRFLIMLSWILVLTWTVLAVALAAAFGVHLRVPQRAESWTVARYDLGRFGTPNLPAGRFVRPRRAVTRRIYRDTAWPPGTAQRSSRATRRRRGSPHASTGARRLRPAATHAAGVAS